MNRWNAEYHVFAVKHSYQSPCSVVITLRLFLSEIWINGS